MPERSEQVRTLPRATPPVEKGKSVDAYSLREVVSLVNGSSRTDAYVQTTTCLRK